MKKKVIISIVIATIILFIVSLITNYIYGAKEKREYIKTYNVIEKLDITDETGIYNYYIIKQFQDNEPILIKVSNNYMLEKNKNYEFVLFGIKKDNIKYTQNEIFDNFEIKNIIETDKIGLEQIQEL